MMAKTTMRASSGLAGLCFDVPTGRGEPSGSPALARVARRVVDSGRVLEAVGGGSYLVEGEPHPRDDEDHPENVLAVVSARTMERESWRFSRPDDEEEAGDE